MIFLSSIPLRSVLYGLILLLPSLQSFVIVRSGLLTGRSSSSSSTSPWLWDTERPIEFSDFGDDFWAGGDGSASSSQLVGSLRTVVEKYQDNRDVKLSQNWKQGNWKVRGFSLDRYNAKEDAISKSTKISRIATGIDSVIVGRTDGSVCLVELGTEYWAKFESQLKIVETSNLTVAVESQLVRDDSDKVSVNEVPFEVIFQFMAHEGHEISAILMKESDEHSDESIVVTADTAGHMTLWNLPDVPGERVYPLRNLEAHSDQIVALKTVNFQGNIILFSASVDGSLALWDLWTGDLVYRCKMEECGRDSCRILSADANDSYIVLGMSSGHVVSFLLSDIVKTASAGEVCPIPNGRFLAHQTDNDGGVTAVACSNDSNTILTGGSDGIIKQWDILQRTQGEITTLEQWPRLSNQRMKHRAHLFQGHENKITALQYHPHAILSAGVDGTVRAWNFKTGKELFSMDGFKDDINSLCLSEDSLITNGMDQFVCLHDFNVDGGSEIEEGYELEW